MTDAGSYQTAAIVLGVVSMVPLTGAVFVLRDMLMYDGPHVIGGFVVCIEVLVAGIGVVLAWVVCRMGGRP